MAQRRWKTIKFDIVLNKGLVQRLASQIPPSAHQEPSYSFMFPKFGIALEDARQFVNNAWDAGEDVEVHMEVKYRRKGR